jgi:hypothetical protein
VAVDAAAPAANRLKRKLFLLSECETAFFFEKEYVEVSSFFAVLAITVFLWLNIAVIARCIFGK